LPHAWRKTTESAADAGVEAHCGNWLLDIRVNSTLSSGCRLRRRT
jgi:hypothetical protein